jgi:GDPmannose 4,6-dehydratase
MARAVIFGVHGQDGYYLSELLRRKEIDVTGVSRSDGNWLKGDVGDLNFVETLIKNMQPDYVFQLAANSKTDHALLFEHQNTIVAGALNILESACKFATHTKIFIPGSGLQFENSGNPINEDTAFIARDAYSLARIQSVYASRYFRNKGIKVYIGYLFHHDSPFRSSVHLSRKIVDAAKAAAEGKNHRLSIGNISVEKEFGFAGDIVKGIFQLLQQDQFFEACIGTGKAYSVEKWLDLCFSFAGKRWQDYIQVQNDYIPEFKRLVSDPSRIRSTGWKPEVEIDELAELMFKSTSIY